MIWTLIVIGLVVFWIASSFVVNHVGVCNTTPWWFDYLDVITGVAAMFAVIFWSIFMLFCRCGYANNIAQKNIEYDSIMQEIESYEDNEPFVFRNMVIQDVNEWNKKVVSVNYWNNNPWTNWFIPDQYAESLNYISWPMEDR